MAKKKLPTFPEKPFIFKEMRCTLLQAPLKGGVLYHYTIAIAEAPLKGKLQTIRNMDGSANQGCNAGDKKYICPKCRSVYEIEYNVNRSQKNFLKPYFACIKCGGFLFWAEEDEIRGGMQLSQSTATSKRKQLVVSGGCHCNELIIELRDQITGIAKDVTEMRMEMKGILGRNIDTSRIVMLHHLLPIPLQQLKIPQCYPLLQW
ncbi:hypothetical protein Cgig2_028264 [Carnegiea gigantea]|uniref:Uncharacterized protein n=1 Tax=Carnegiea gigantea TaxID=171969 RepID=A0A9Q1GM45_9CARY|nr:hypothetical protein Cgig2_028264 [Carnegiea gigantea]